MDLLTFITKFSEAFAWPIALLLGIGLLRRPIIALLPMVQKLKYKEFEVDFGKRVEEISSEVGRELPNSITQQEYEYSVIDPIFKLAEISPRAAVLEAWRILEIAALTAARKLNGQTFRYKTLTYQVLNSLEKSNNIDQNILNLIKNFRSLRNDAAHAPEVALSKESAIEYANAVKPVIKYFYSVAA